MCCVEATCRTGGDCGCTVDVSHISRVNGLAARFAYQLTLNCVREEEHPKESNFESAQEPFPGAIASQSNNAIIPDAVYSRKHSRIPFRNATFFRLFSHVGF